MRNHELFWLLLCLSPAGAWALESDRDQPIQVQADRASLDDIKGITIYEGNVVVTQGTTQLRGDKVTLTYDAEKEVEKIVAEGNPARFKQRPDNRDEDIQAQAKRLEYYGKQDMLHLITEALVQQGKDKFSAQKITYDAKRELITAEGDKQQRVNVVIEPKKAQPSDKAQTSDKARKPE
jgi:lipopolysaccharide export system protein LptA